MTQQQYIINRKLNILELGQTLGNISDACRRLGVSRQHYYDIKAAITEEGLEGLLEKSRCAPRIGNRVPSMVEQALLDYSLEFPTHGQTRTANELKKKGLWVVGADMDGEADYFASNLTGPIVLVIGAEGKGLGRLVKENCDLLVKIPMCGGVSSLNASAAGAILLFDIVRQRAGE